MDVRNNLDGLRSLLGVNTPAVSTASQKSSAQAGASDLGGDHATLSSVGNEVSQQADGVRMDKVAAVQAALAAGTYNVSASAVASSMVDAMIAGGN